MKKIGLFIAIVMCFGLLSACESPMYSKAKDNIAEIRNNIFIGENENVKATFMSGKREKEYVINGTSTLLIEFGVITFALLGDNVTRAKTGNYKVIIDSKTYEGQLELNPFDNTYVADLGSMFDSSDNIYASINVGSFESEVTLELKNGDWQTSSTDALQIACKTLKKELKDYDKDVWSSEVYIKIIHDDKVASDKYFWYVNFVGRDGTNHSVIIDPYTKEILAKK